MDRNYALIVVLAGPFSLAVEISIRYCSISLAKFISENS